MEKIIPYVDEEFLNLVPRPTDKQYKDLKESIRKQGLLKAIEVAPDGKVLDGHTRFEICEELDIPKRYIVKNITDEAEQRIYAVTLNLKRRHLTDFQIVELLEKDLYNIKAEARAYGYSTLPGAGRTKKHKREDLRRSERSPYAEIAPTIGVGAVKIEKIIRIKENCSPRVVQQVRDGKISVSQAIDTIEEKHSAETRAKYMKDKITTKRIFEYCPKCGTKTLESWYRVKESHCTKCDYYYSIKRRHH